MPSSDHACRHALIAAGRVHSVLATEDLDDRMSSFEPQVTQYVTR